MRMDDDAMRYVEDAMLTSLFLGRGSGLVEWKVRRGILVVLYS